MDSTPEERTGPPHEPLPRMPDPQRPSTIKVLVIICVIGVLLTFTCIGGFVWFIMSGKAEVEPAADTFLDALAEGDYAAAYDQLAPQWKQKRAPGGSTVWHLGHFIGPKIKEKLRNL